MAVFDAAQHALLATTGLYRSLILLLTGDKEIEDVSNGIMLLPQRSFLPQKSSKYAF